MGALVISKDATLHRADNEDSDQTARMRRLIFVGRTCQKVRFLTLRFVSIFVQFPEIAWVTISMLVLFLYPEL